MLTVGSLFAGIGGFDLGFERAGFEIKWQVEIDPFCRQVLAKHWPAVKRYEDVRECCTGTLRRSRDDQRCAECGRRDYLPSVDVLCGGFPCQDISVAGAGAGIDGERSGLWSHYARLISELRPRYVVVENVSALLGRGVGRVLGDLAARGYDAEWDCIPASAVRAPHQRDRVWIVAYPSDGQSQQQKGADAETLLGRRPRASGGIAGRGSASRVPVGRRVVADGGSDVADTASDGRLTRREGDTAEVERGRQSSGSGVGQNAMGDADGR